MECMQIKFYVMPKLQSRNMYKVHKGKTKVHSKQARQKEPPRLPGAVWFMFGSKN